MRFLLVEDDPRLLLSLSEILERNGYLVDKAKNFEEGYEKVFLAEYDLIILDWMLPDGNGVDLCRKIRSEKITVPILLLTAKAMTEDITEGLDSGADDYLTKPFEIEELQARIRALLRRKEEFVSDCFTLDNLKIDFLKKIVTRGEKNINLSPKENLILEYLAKNSDKVVSREELLNHAWDEKSEALSNTVDVYISYLRKKIDLAGETPLINTVKGVGYRLCKN
jgi:DNA-binding response OmpR family regulator